MKSELRKAEGVAVRAPLSDAKPPRAPGGSPEMSIPGVKEWLDFPAADPPRRLLLDAVRPAFPDARAMADAFRRARESGAWEAFLFGVMLERALRAESKPSQ